jgi:hypothetical protein
MLRLPVPFRNGPWRLPARIVMRIFAVQRGSLP